MTQPLKNKNSKHISALGAAALGTLMSAAANAMLPIVVSESFDDGSGIVEGSFSWALEQAAASAGLSTIVVATEMDIDVMGPLVYDGAGRLEIYGSGQTLRASGDFTVFEASQGASISIKGLGFVGPGGPGHPGGPQRPGAGPAGPSEERPGGTTVEGEFERIATGTSQRSPHAQPHRRRGRARRLQSPQALRAPSLV